MTGRVEVVELRSDKPITTLRTAGLTVTALVGFAANSVLCRAALGEATIDAASFSTVRLLSGAITLGVAHRLASGARAPVGAAGSWVAAALLFSYAVPFSFAHASL